MALPEEPESIETLEARRQALEQTLGEADHRLRETSEVLYGLQQRYASEHFELQEAMRNLKIERLRNAGIHAAHAIVLHRYGVLRERVADLKARLQNYEQVDYEDIDDATPSGDSNAPQP
jgi:chromosome segregation ATPase